MFKQLINHSLRAFRRQKGYFIINTLGLAVGISCTIIIMLFVMYEVSYDNYHVNKNLIYRILLNGKIGGQEVNVSSIASIVGPTLSEELPEVDNFLRMNSMTGTVVTHGEDSFIEDDFIEADSSFFDFFSIPMLAGDPESALAGPKQLVISKSTAKKIFGDENPMNQTILVGNDSIYYTVKGVMEDLPSNTHFKASIIRSFMTNERSRDPAWTNNSFETYILVNPNSDPASVEAGMAKIIEKYVGAEVQQYMGITIQEFFAQGNKYGLYLQALKKIHLQPEIEQSLSKPTDPNYLYVFGCVALLMIVIASINYMNLSTAQASRRAREVGIKKVSGSTKGMLIGQFLTESLALTGIALLIALVLVQLSLPYFSNLLGIDLKVDCFGNAYMIPGLFLLAVIIGFMSGTYPAFFISSFKPVDVLKGRLRSNSKNGRLRSVLVVFQFSVSIALIIGTIIMYNQISFLLNKDVGFDKENLMVIKRAGVLRDQVKVFKDEVNNLAGVEIVSVSTAVPNRNNNNNSYWMDGRSDGFLMVTNWIDNDFFETYKIELEGGRNFNEEFPSDQKACIVNAKAIEDYNFDDPFNVRFRDEPDADGNPAYMPIIGSVNNFHFASLHGPIKPYMFRYKEDGIYFGYVTIRLTPAADKETINQIEKIWKSLAGHEPLQYYFMGDDFDRLYSEEKESASLAIIFSIITIIIAALGLFGLTSFTLQQRTKEIGIRKTMGSTTCQVFFLIAKDIFVLLGISSLIACPAIYFVMKNWLENFYYRVDITVWPFIIGSLVAILIALITLSYKTLKAARTNPAESLQYE
jgi:putative ABC transport system permease protein